MFFNLSANNLITVAIGLTVIWLCLAVCPYIYVLEYNTIQYNIIQYSFIWWNDSISTDVDGIGFTIISLN